MAQLIAGTNDLATVDPLLASQLVDPSLATTLTKSSGKTVHWFCYGTTEVPHPRREWSATVATRSKGHGCAVCAGKAALAGWNDIATLQPELAAQLVDQSLATTLMRFSNKSVRWFCDGTSDVPHLRYEWFTTAGHRTRGQGCAVCAGRAVLVGFNDLATVDPSLAAQLVDPSLATTLTKSSGKMVHWFCDGTDEVPHPRYEWSTPVYSRSAGRGCAVCVGRAVLVGWNDVATVDPLLAAQLVDPSLATTLTKSSGKTVHWFCYGTTEVPHPRREWSATVATRTAGNGCAVCSGQAVLVGFNDLATVDLRLAAQLVDPSVATTLTSGSGKSVGWFCDGTNEVPHPRREWSATVADRSQGNGCAVCSGKAVLVGFNDLATADPELAAQLVDPSLATTLTKGSAKTVQWFCHGTNAVPHPRYEWSSKVADRTNGQGCAVCSHNTVLVGFNDLATADPELAAQLVDPSLATTFSRFSNKSVQWFCDGTDQVAHGRYEWSATVNNRSNGNGCPVCAGRAVLVGSNDLATVDPLLASQLVDPTLATTLTRFANRSVRWFCDGTNEVPHPRREWFAKVSDRSQGNGCGVCSGQVVLVGFNDLATRDPLLASQLVDPSIATTLTRFANRSVRWFCDGTDEVPHPRREWFAKVSDRSQGRGCAVCALSGFDPSKTGWLYLLRHEVWNMQQIGITNSPDDRIGTHSRSGWELVDIRKFDDGAFCAATERAALRAIRSRGGELGRTGIHRKFDGYTEAWPTASLELNGLAQLLDWVRQAEWSDGRIREHLK